ncbi:MAG: tetratricopeptide repeat protein [Gammaproteobacteria bacterium]|nr:tetratricopeptide repeat protein [Gammaproteobacteria bacterium]
MPIALPVPLLSRLGIFFVILICAACSVPEAPSNRYHSDAEDSQLESGPVKELQNQAIAAINQQRFQQARDYLQRAIKIQPRNAWNWHYLAQTYWHEGQYDRCLAMLERSRSYTSSEDLLRVANDWLEPKCQG